jgi:outer membrane lipoprotein carrier protein
MSRLLRGLAAFSFVVGLNCSLAVADDSQATAFVPTDASPEVLAVVQAVEDTYRDVDILQAHFEQTVTAMGQTREDQGEVLLSRPRKMRWDFTGPTGSLFVTDGTYMWVYMKHLKQAYKYEDLGEAATSVAPIELSDLGSLRDKFTVVLAPESGRKSSLILILTPKETGKYPFKEVRLELTNKYVLKTISVTDTLDNLTELRFTKVKFNPDVPDSMFSFEPPPDVEVIEAGPL